MFTNFMHVSMASVLTTHAGMASTRSTVRKVTVQLLAPVIMVQGDHIGSTVTQDNHIMLITLFL